MFGSLRERQQVTAAIDATGSEGLAHLTRCRCWHPLIEIDAIAMAPPTVCPE